MRDTPLNRYVFAPLFVLLGVAIIARTIAAGGGSVGIIFGVLFVLAGAARLYVAWRASRDEAAG